MTPNDISTVTRQVPDIYVLSCGQGINGEQLARSALVQFPRVRSKVVKIPHVLRAQQVTDTLDRVEAAGGIIAHTIVDPVLRGLLVSESEKRKIPSIDLMGPVIDTFESVFGEAPICEPGRYRKFNQVDMDRVTAIEFAVGHDDGLNPQDLAKAEIVLVGLSRSGKTPLSMYLSVLGWKVANVPVVIGIPLPAELMAINRKRVIALYIDPEQLISHRQIRRRRMGLNEDMAYAGKGEIFREVDAARELYRRHGFASINVSNKPIESSAEEVVELIERRFPDGGHKRGYKAGRDDAS